MVEVNLPLNINHKGFISLFLYYNIKTTEVVFMKENTLGLTKTETKICYLSFLNLRLNEEAILLGVSPDSANKFRSRTRQKLCPGQKGSDINRFILQKGW